MYFVTPMAKPFALIPAEVNVMYLNAGVSEGNCATFCHGPPRTNGPLEFSACLA